MSVFLEHEQKKMKNVFWLSDCQSRNIAWKGLAFFPVAKINVDSIIKDPKNKISKLDLNASIKRATPRQWAQYSTAKLAINLMTGSTPMGIKLKAKCYVNDWIPGRGSVPDTSRLKIGRYSFPNRLQCLKKLDFDWCTGISKDRLRINLKKCFVGN